MTPSAETWPSSIASSSADWVFGGVRLISSASSRLVKTGPSRKSSSARCRAVDHQRAGDVAGHQVGRELHPAGVDRQGRGQGADEERLRRTGHALHQHVAAAEEGDEQAGHGGVLADDGLAHLVPDGEQPLAKCVVRRVAGAGGDVGHPRRTSLSSCGEFLGELDQALVRARDGGLVGEEGADLLLGAAEVPGDGLDDVGLGRAATEPEVVGEPAPGGGAQRAGGVGAVVRAAIHPAPAAGRLDGADDDRQRLGARASPSGGRATGSARSRRRPRATATGAIQSGANVQRLTASSSPASSNVGTYQTSRSCSPSRRRATAALSPRSTWSLLSASPGAEELGRPGAGRQHEPAVAGEAAGRGCRSRRRRRR